ncbi:unannotated protein [freshwater metagenome]|uniref:Unannotated protein n=1 Tax=freshwater metagenome TaxID=449393 RepID=A0A6J7K9H2_9ZZZZ
MTSPAGTPGRPIPGQPDCGEPEEITRPSEGSFDPLRLCIFATIALIAWLLGPFALLGFALLGFAGYWRAHRAGLTQSRCYLRDVRLVLIYLAALSAVGVVFAVREVVGWLG